MKRTTQITVITVFTTLFLLMNWHIVTGLQTVITYTYFSLLFWTVIASTTFLFLYALSGIRTRGMGNFFKFITHVALIIFVSELTLFLFLAANDAFRFLVGSYHLIAEQNFIAPARSETWTLVGIGASLLMIFLFIYGMVKGKYAYRVIKHTLYFKDLPAAFDGFKIVQISDVHAGSLENHKAVQKGIDLINRQHADVFVFTGDLVNNKAEEIKPFIPLFSQIKAPFGQFSILGNHDYGDYVKWPSQRAKQENLQQLKNYHKDLGFKLLLDEHVVLRKGDEKIILAGVENWGLGFGERGDLNKAIRGTTVDDFKVLLSHDPTHWEAQVKKHPLQVHLTLAGHTHGMQFGFEAFGIKWSPVKFRYKHWAGLKEENNSVLNINRGFGFIGFSGRVGIWPEISLIELKKMK